MRQIVAGGFVFLAVAVIAASCAEGETLDPEAIHPGGHAGQSRSGGTGGMPSGGSGDPSSAGSSVTDGVTGGGGSGTSDNGGGGASAMGGGGNASSSGGASGASAGGSAGQGGNSGAAGADGGPKDATVSGGCDAGSSCVQCAEQKCPAKACAKCEDQNHVNCTAACEAMLACAIQHAPCGGANDGICFNQCNQVINAQPGGSPPRDWTNALIACGCQ